MPLYLMLKIFVVRTTLLMLTSIIVGYFMTYGYELYYEINGEYEIEQPIDFTPSNHDVSAEVQHGHHYHIVFNSNSRLHPHGEDRHS